MDRKTQCYSVSKGTQRHSGVLQTRTWCQKPVWKNPCGIKTDLLKHMCMHTVSRATRFVDLFVTFDIWSKTLIEIYCFYLSVSPEQTKPYSYPAKKGLQVKLFCLFKLPLYLSTVYMHRPSPSSVCQDRVSKFLLDNKIQFISQGWKYTHYVCGKGAIWNLHSRSCGCI